MKYYGIRLPQKRALHTCHMINKMETLAVIPLDISSNKRFEQLKEAFHNKFGKDPEFYGRAPGRVNIIGEHIDYCGYGVLPMAITQDIVIAAAADDSNNLTLANHDGSFPDHTREKFNVTIDSSQLQWYNYFMCGYRGIVEHAEMKAPKGLQMMLHGIVPPSAGLSSSSAFVCCAALTTMHANKLSIPKLVLADICQRCEHYIGTEGGGMDQACSLLAQADTAKYIEFNPLTCTDVSLPGGATFVISNSCVEMNKAASSHYNIRVVECRLGAQIIAKNKGLDWHEIRRLGDLQQKLSVELNDMAALVDEILHKETYTREEVCQLLGVTDEELVSTSLSANTTHLQSFSLYQRATHVYKEANRVLQFKRICDERPSDVLKQLGDLMNDSHASCRDMYECSHPKLDQLVNVCVASGALGSRLTGAGWGGCAVSMVPDDKLQSFLENVAKEFYKDALDNLSDKIFATKPGSGACIYIPS